MAKILQGEIDNFEGVSQPIVKYKEYSACGQFSEPYSVGGSSYAAFCCQYYSSLFLVSVVNDIISRSLLNVRWIRSH